MQQHDFHGGEEHHLRRIIAALEPCAERKLGDAEMGGELRHASQDEACAMQRARLCSFA